MLLSVTMRRLTGEGNLALNPGEAAVIVIQQSNPESPDDGSIVECKLAQEADPWALVSMLAGLITRTAEAACEVEQGKEAMLQKLFAMMKSQTDEAAKEQTGPYL